MNPSWWVSLGRCPCLEGAFCAPEKCFEKRITVFWELGKMNDSDTIVFWGICLIELIRGKYQTFLSLVLLHDGGYTGFNLRKKTIGIIVMGHLELNSHGKPIMLGIINVF